jgi:hypothetical protein
MLTGLQQVVAKAARCNVNVTLILEILRNTATKGFFRMLSSRFCISFLLYNRENLNLRMPFL